MVYDVFGIPCKYEGEVNKVTGQACGYGMAKKGDGSKYEGMWFADKLEGIGT